MGVVREGAFCEWPIPDRVYDVTGMICRDLENVLVAGNNMDRLAEIWQNNQLLMDEIENYQPLLDFVIQKKDYYKQLIREQKVPEYFSARLRCVSKMVYEKIWRFHYEKVKDKTGNGVLRLHNLVFNSLYQEKILSELQTKFEIRYDAETGFNLWQVSADKTEIVNHCKGGLSTATDDLELRLCSSLSYVFPESLKDVI
jgi:hypothetical protein